MFLAFSANFCTLRVEECYYLCCCCSLRTLKIDAAELFSCVCAFRIFILYVIHAFIISIGFCFESQLQICNYFCTRSKYRYTLKSIQIAPSHLTCSTFLLLLYIHKILVIYYYFVLLLLFLFNCITIQSIALVMSVSQSAKRVSVVAVINW